MFFITLKDIRLLFVLANFTVNNATMLKNNQSLENQYKISGEYLIEGENCKIPNLNPFSKEAMSVFTSQAYEKCNKIAPLTSVEYHNDGAKLIINEKLKKDYILWFYNEMSCCYQRITRKGVNASADNEFSLSNCKNIKTGHLLDKEDEFILVTCKAYRDIPLVKRIQSEIYKNAHAIITQKSEKVEKKSMTNVLLIGIDSISRLNVIRAMPSTYKYLEEKNWLEMKAFNKIADNTFPNLMAILTGYNQSVISEKCNWKEVGGLEKCRFLWDDFKDANYSTAFAEDAMQIATFNYYNTGFIKPPTDYYLRPFALAVEQHLKVVYDNPWNAKCVGYQHYADFVYQYALDFAVQHQNDSYFGLFWTNSFSHDELNMPSSYDIRMKFFLEQMEDQGVLNDTIVIFFSDHGMRFGDIRKYFTGWLEERTPFLFIWFPQTFKEKYPELMRNVMKNRDRLVSPYDLYVTLKDILNISEESSIKPIAHSCPTCQSLFEEISINRSCNDAGIDYHWCTCSAYNETNILSPIITKITNNVIKKLNSDLSQYKKCAKLKLKHAISARKSIRTGYTDYLISFQVLPSDGQMEATVRCNDRECKNLEIIGDVSRINRYGKQSSCISDANLRKYCYCS